MLVVLNEVIRLKFSGWKERTWRDTKKYSPA